MAVRYLTEKEFFQGKEHIAVTVSEYKPTIEDHRHDFYEIAYITHGSGYHIINGKKDYISEGSLILITPGSIHNYSGDSDLRWINILFEPQAANLFQINTQNAESIISSVLLSDFFHFNIKTLNNNADWIIYEMLSEYDARKSGYQEVLNGYLQVLLTKLFRTAEHRENTALSMIQNSQALKETVITLLNRGINVSSESLAQRAFLSGRAFSNLFKKACGETLTQFSRRYKIERACMLLSETDLSVSEIMEKVNMTDPKNFFAAFKKYTSTTPKKYREKNRNKLPDKTTSL